MRLMSFSMTAPQVEEEQKTETRRLGWRGCYKGQRIVAVEKAMGLGPGGRPRPLKVIEVVEVWTEPLNMVDVLAVEREGYPGKTQAWFVGKFCRAMKCTPTRVVTVIQFRYVRYHEMMAREKEQWVRLVGRWGKANGV